MKERISWPTQNFVTLTQTKKFSNEYLIFTKRNTFLQLTENKNFPFKKNYFTCIFMLANISEPFFVNLFHFSIFYIFFP